MEERRRTIQGSRRGGHSGFTFLELLIVMSLIGLLVLVALPMYRDATLRAKEAVLKENLFEMRDAIDQFHTDQGRYPNALQELEDKRYLRRIPKDPITESADTWVVEYAPYDMLSPGETPGVWDVHSGSEELAMDGTPYREW